MLNTLNISAITGLGLLLITGYLCGLLAHRLKLPALTGYLAAGVLLGPSGLHMFTGVQLHQLDFLTSISFGCIAFIIGLELRLLSLKKLGLGIVVITFSQLLLAFLVVSGAVYWLTGDLVLSLLFGAIAPASAPAGTVAVIKEYKAKGPLTKVLYAVVGFDDCLAVILFALVLGAVKVLLADAGMAGLVDIMSSISASLLEIGGSILLGGAIGLLFSCMVKHAQYTSQKTPHLVLIFWIVLLGVGLTERWHLSLILVCMTIGFTFTNTNREQLTDNTKEPLQNLMNFLFVFFFGMTGLRFNLSVMSALGLIGVIYVIARIIGKLLGVWLAAKIFRMNKIFSHYLGLGILSQAGVAIGFALLIQKELAHFPGTEFLGEQILTIVTATSIFFEIVGPLAAKYALKKADEIPDKPA